ncbi:hypothetical protein ACF1BE_23820 [Streptomyces sp. NPDC014991]
MSAASVEQPPFHDDEPFSLTAIAEEIMERHPATASRSSQATSS